MLLRSALWGFADWCVTAKVISGRNNLTAQVVAQRPAYPRKRNDFVEAGITLINHRRSLSAMPALRRRGMRCASRRSEKNRQAAF